MNALSFVARAMNAQVSLATTPQCSRYWELLGLYREGSTELVRLTVIQIVAAQIWEDMPGSLKLFKKNILLANRIKNVE